MQASSSDDEGGGGSLPPPAKIAMLEQEIKSKCYRLVLRNPFHPIRKTGPMHRGSTKPTLRFCQKSAGSVASEHNKLGDCDKLYQKLFLTAKLSGLRDLIGVDCFQVPKPISTVAQS